VHIFPCQLILIQLALLTLFCFIFVFLFDGASTMYTRRPQPLYMCQYATLTINIFTYL